MNHAEVSRQTAFAQREARKESETLYKERSHDRLGEAVKRHGNTLIIGILARVEEAFGELWGEGRPATDLTQEERYWRAVKEEFREAMLDHGHAKIRTILKELDEYAVEWLRHSVVFSGSTK